MPSIAPRPKLRLHRGFTYDALSRNLTQTGPHGTSSSIYDLAGRRTKLTYPGAGLFIDHEYLITGETTKLRENGAVSGVGVLATYAYDDLGRRTGVTFGNGASQAFGFDPVSRLASLTNNLTGTANDLTATFAYNPASQIASAVRTGDTYAWTGHGSGTTASVANGLNQLTTIGGSATTHDSKGNLTTDPTTARTYGYSSENLLTSASGGVTLGYDPLLRLHQLAGAATTRFAYDGLDAIAEYNGGNTLQRRYVHGPGMDQPVVWYEGTGTTDRRFLGSDERGSIISVSDSAGTMLNLNRYDEYGKPQSTNTGRFQYTGQMWLGELGAYYYKARMYSPTFGGRFLQTDPIGYEDSLNLYAYVLNDPVNFVDPLGLAWVCVGTAWGDGPFYWRCGNQNESPGGFWSFGGVGGGRGEGGASAGETRPPPPPPKEDEDKDPKSSDCSSWLAGPTYKAGGILSTVGTTLIGMGAAVAFVGAGNPITNTAGLTLAGYGTAAFAVGTYAQLTAGMYFALHGNRQPLTNAVAKGTLGLVRTPKVANPALDNIADNALDKAQSEEEKCAP